MVKKQLVRKVNIIVRLSKSRTMMTGSSAISTLT